MISAIEPMTMKMQIGGKRKPRKSRKGTKRKAKGNKKKITRRHRRRHLR